MVWHIGVRAAHAIRPMLALAVGLGALAAATGEASAQRRGRADIVPAVTVVEVKLQRVNERVAAVSSGRARQ